MKSFKAFRLDTANHIVSRDGDGVPIAPQGFDVLAHPVEHAGQVVTQNESLEALWPETYVNPEVLRKCILEIRKALCDREGNPNSLKQCLTGDTNLLLKVSLPVGTTSE